VLSDENGLKLTIRPEGWSTLLRERKFPEVVQQCGLLDLLDERCREIHHPGSCRGHLRDAPHVGVHIWRTGAHHRQQGIERGTSVRAVQIESRRGRRV
jgi:hypothetical protein